MTSLSPELSADIEAVIQDCLQFGDADIMPADPTLFGPQEHVPFAGFSSQELQRGLVEYFELKVPFDQSFEDGQRIGYAKVDPAVVLLSNGVPDQYYLILTQ